MAERKNETSLMMLTCSKYEKLSTYPLCFSSSGNICPLDSLFVLCPSHIITNTLIGLILRRLAGNLKSFESSSSSDEFSHTKENHMFSSIARRDEITTKQSAIVCYRFMHSFRVWNTDGRPFVFY